MALFLNGRNQSTTAIAEIDVASTDRRAVLERFHAPTLGPANAPVTLVEFFDPSCETCRAFYPLVKQILANFPTEVRLVIRYAPFHQGSDEAVRILEAARDQDLYLPVLDALIARQPEWAAEGAPDLDHAWAIAVEAGLDLTLARAYAGGAQVATVLAQDDADLRSLNITATPTFFVNGTPLVSFGAQQLVDLVTAEVLRSRQN
ncbi:MAG: DsbA family protein [Bauldia sp.]